MKPHCILFYGNSQQPTIKYAGTFRIASELRKHGYDVQCIDITAFDKFDDCLKEVLTNIVTEKTLWVGFSTTFLTSIFGFPYYRSQKTFDLRFAKYPGMSKGIIDFVKLVKEKSPRAKFIAGGSRKFMLEQFGFKSFKSHSDKEIIEFTQWCGGTNKTPRLDFFSNAIDGSEFKEFHRSQNIYIPEDIIDENDSLPIEVSRGCIFKCKFCSFPMNGKTKGDWVKESTVLLDELKRNYEEHGITNYTFSDDTYNDSADKVKRLYDDVFSKLPFKLAFTTYIRLDLMIRFPDTVDYLVNSGLKSALFGIETINHESGKLIGKGLDPKIQFQFIEEIKKNQFKDIMTYSGFIAGLPKDTQDYLDDLEEFLMSDKNKLDFCLVNSLSISPKNIENVNKNFYSEFDLEYEKYGYECWEQIEDSPYTEIRWKNNNTGLTSDITHKFANDLNNRIRTSKKFKLGGFAYPYHRLLGIPEQDLLSLSIPEITAKYNIKELENTKRSMYRERLLRLSRGNNVL